MYRFFKQTNKTKRNKINKSAWSRNNILIGF